MSGHKTIATFIYIFSKVEINLRSRGIFIYIFSKVEINLRSRGIFSCRACAKRCSARTNHFLVLNASSGLSFFWTNLTLSERVCIKEIIKINLTPKVSSELVKYENLHQVRAENWQRKGGHFGCTASVVVLFASFFFRQFSLCCLTGHSQSFLMLVKTAHNYL